jgi:hypothetical protein
MAIPSIFSPVTFGHSSGSTKQSPPLTLQKPQLAVHSPVSSADKITHSSFRFPDPLRAKVHSAAGWFTAKIRPMKSPGTSKRLFMMSVKVARRTY